MIIIRMTDAIQRIDGNLVLYVSTPTPQEKNKVYKQKKMGHL